jgi:hypothetical protein
VTTFDDTRVNHQLVILYGSASGLAWEARSVVLSDPEFVGDPRFEITDGTGFEHGIAGTTDVNGDGFPDLALLGGPRNDGGNGTVYLYLGSASGLRVGPASTIHAPAGSHFVYFASGGHSPGDLDGDGYADVVVGAAMAHGGSWTAHALVYRGGPDGLDATPATQVDLPDQWNDESVAVVGDGDLTGDGLADVIVGGTRFGGSGVGHLLAGTASVGLEATPVRELVGVDNPIDARVFASGDVNGDGLLDAVVSTQTSQFVYEATATGVPTMPTTTLALGDYGDRVEGGSPGDLDGDGYDDLLFRRTYEPPGTADATYYRGSPTGVLTLHPTSFQIGDLTDLGLPGGVLLEVVFPGDVDGDALDDVVCVVDPHVAFLETGSAIAPYLVDRGAIGYGP